MPWLGFSPSNSFASTLRSVSTMTPARQLSWLRGLPGRMTVGMLRLLQEVYGCDVAPACPTRQEVHEGVPAPRGPWKRAHGAGVAGAGGPGSVVRGVDPPPGLYPARPSGKAASPLALRVYQGPAGL